MRKLGTAWLRAPLLSSPERRLGRIGIDFSRRPCTRGFGPTTAVMAPRRPRSVAGQMSLFETVEALRPSAKRRARCGKPPRVAFAAQRRALEAAWTATGRQAAATEPASATERSIADGRKTLDSPLLSVA